MGKRAVGLYVHIPFCVKKCGYCDFLSAPGTEKEKEDYVDLLCREIEREAHRYPGYRGETVFFGGGTPTVLKPEQLERILGRLSACFCVGLQSGGRMIGGTIAEEAGKTDEGKAGAGETVLLKEAEIKAEITLECNPGTVKEEDLRKLRRAGFNRLSIGLQSAQDEELKRLGRVHNWEDFLETYHAARRAGFRNINVDIMSALPGQSAESYEDTLRRVTELRPEHVSAYSLIIEEGTPFYERFGEAERQRQKYGEDREHLLPSEEEERRMYEMTEEMLGQAGYRRYEISNYALPGHECRHNITYWRRGDYLGFGLGAASLMENCRFTKSRDMKEYADALRRDQVNSAVPGKEKEKELISETAETKQGTGVTGGRHREEQCLSTQEQMEEFMFLGLRMMEGISAGGFQEYFHVPVEEIYGEVLSKLEEQKLLARSGDKIFLTKRGIDVSNAVLAEFLF